MREIKKIIVHCSDSEFGDAKEIDNWHRERGFECIGYHLVLLNGLRKAHGEYSTEDDGLIEHGRPLSMIGAHCEGHNSDSIGICLIGVKDFTKTQKVKLYSTLKALMQEYTLCPANVYGHYEMDTAHGKTCPNTDMDIIRAGLLPQGHPISEKYA